jgi:hypothetical protein
MRPHYDVDAAVNNFVAAMQASKSSPKASKANIIQNRNCEVRAALLRFMLTEHNRGSQIPDIVEAMADIVAEFLGNMMVPYDDEGRRLFCDLFSMRVSASLAQALRRVASGTAPSAKLPHEQGGHA